MKNKLLMELVLVASCLSAWAEPGGSYTLTGEEKGIEEIIKADMAQYPILYEGVNTRSYLSKFKKKNKIGKSKFSPGDILYFPDTLASLRAKKERSEVQEEEKSAELNELPPSFKLSGLAQVVQEGSYCCPASGAVIAKFHGIETDQWEIAKLSSQGSMDNSGTNPADMARALENFGIVFHSIEYKNALGNTDDFVEKTLPQFKKALVHNGPMYISIREVFGENHGCVVIGYSDKREKMYFYNPWGDEFNLSYKAVAKYSYRAIAFTPPKLMGDKTIDCTSLIETLKKAVPDNARNVIELRRIMEDSVASFEFIECNRIDVMNDASKTERLATREGQKLIDLALERVPAILIPQTEDGVTDYMFISKSPESKNKLLVQRIGSRGWGTPELIKPRELMRYWTTAVDVNGRKQWLLPLFEFSGTIKAQPEH